MCVYMCALVILKGTPRKDTSRPENVKFKYFLCRLHVVLSIFRSASLFWALNLSFSGCNHVDLILQMSSRKDWLMIYTSSKCSSLVDDKVSQTQASRYKMAVLTAKFLQLSNVNF